MSAGASGHGEGRGCSGESGSKSVTVADFGSQALICHAIGEAFPEAAIVAEEDSQTLQENPQLMQRVTGYLTGFAEGTPSPQTVWDWIDWGGGEVGERSGRWTRLMARKGFAGRINTPLRWR